MAREYESTSPLTGEKSQVIKDILRDIYEYREDIGTWGATDTVFEDGFKRNGKYNSSDLRLSQRDTERALSLACSVVWRAQRSGQKPPFLFTAEGIRANSDRIKETLGQNWNVLSPESLWSDYQKLTFEKKAIETLLNLTLEEEQVGNGVKLAVSLATFPGHVLANRGDEYSSAHGLLHACSGAEGPMVIRFLQQRGWVVLGDDEADAEIAIYVSPEGYAVSDQFRSGARREGRRAFMVCRFIPELDDMFGTCYKPAGDHEDVACPIRRVKDVHHVDRIDDKIVQMIDEASIVVVDLTEQNFNVAFEAGYALALGKPIVWTMREDPGDFRPPFDIQSQNILRWNPDKLDEFREALRYRMIAALNKQWGRL